MEALDTEVVVVGAGPVGLMLAGELRLGGADVVVLEQREAPTTESRASTLHARTMEIFDSRGLLAALGTPPNEPRGHFGGIPLDLTLPTPFPGQWKVPQTRTEELLQDWAVELGADLRRGWEVVGLEAGADRVEVAAVGRGGEALRVRARHVVACDGERSTVRRLTGAEFPGRPAARELLRADVDGIDIPDRRFERLGRGLAIAARRGDGVTRVMVHEFGTAARPRPAAEAPEFAEVVEAWRRVTGEDIGSGTPLWVNSFGDANRQLARYREGRVLFAGDAAHEQMPSGGQALNLGLQDAVNLGWKLALEVRGSAPVDLLDSYHRERHAVGRRVLANIRTQGQLLLGGPEVEPVRALLTELIALPEVREHLAGMISGLDIRYRLGDDHPAVGTRLPHTTVPAAHLPGSGRGLLLDLTGELRPALARTAGPWSDRVGTAAVRPEPGSALHGADAVLVRPDGYLAWVGQDGLPAALRRWFGAPDKPERPESPGSPDSPDNEEQRERDAACL